MDFFCVNALKIKTKHLKQTDVTVKYRLLFNEDFVGINVLPHFRNKKNSAFRHQVTIFHYNLAKANIIEKQ